MSTGNIKNIVNRITAFVMLMFVVGVLLIPSFDAATDIKKDTAYQMAEEIVDGGATKLISQMLNDSSSPAYIIFDTFVRDTRTIEYWDPVNGTTYGTGAGRLTQSLRSLTVAMQAFAGVYLAIIIVSELITQLISGRDPFEGICQAFFQIGVGGIMIVNAPRIISLLILIGIDLIQSAGSISSGVIVSNKSNTTGPKTILDAIVGGDGYTPDLAEGKHGLDKVEAVFQVMGQKITCTATLIIPWLGAIIAKGLALFLIIQVCIEVALRKALVPFAVVDIYKDGIRSPGIRYMKKIFASVLKIMMIVVISKLTAGLSGLVAVELQEHMLPGLAMMVIAQFSAIGVMFKGGDYVSDALHIN